MDIWVVAAAAGAGYVAKHCKNLVQGRQSLSDSFCETPNVRPESSLICQKDQEDNSYHSDLLHSKGHYEDEYSQREWGSSFALMAEKASTSCSECQNRVSFSDCANSSNSGSSLVPGLPSCQDVQGVQVHGDVDESDRDISIVPSTREMSVSYGFSKKKSRLKSRRNSGQFLKPLSSLESCLMAQLYKGLEEVEGYTHNSDAPPCTPSVRPFLVADGSGISSQSSGDYFCLPIGAVENRLHTVSNLQESRTVFGIPQLPSVGIMEFQTKAKPQMKMEPAGRLWSSIGVKGQFEKLQGFSHGAWLFFLGMSIGLISSVLVNKREVENLNEKLKQTKSLVQDLQEELEMKDSLTVKELAMKDYESQGTQNEAINNGPLHTSSPEERLDDYRNEYNNQKSEEESFSKIEAELEAELERLELNMNSCGFNRNQLNLVELDSDSVPDVVEGEFRADILGWRSGTQPYAREDGSGSSTPQLAHYAVSPRELTLRLHEVVQSRLEQRVEELELALQNSQMKVRHMEAQTASYLRELSNSKSRSSSIKVSPVVKEQSPADQPVVINLSGEALDAYNEACDDFTKTNELEEEDTPAGFKKIHPLKAFPPSDEEIYWVHNGEAGNEIRKKLFNDRRQEQGDGNYLSNGFVTSEDENDNGYNEMEELLIRHIVEQARKGSPVVLNAQRALGSPNENEHLQ